VSEDRPAPALIDLPHEVRHRVHVLAAEVLPDVAKLPAPLRKVAHFAPARRARLGAGAMTAALDADGDFRDRVGVQVAGSLPQPVEDLMDLAPGGSPVIAAAVAWLCRPDGWQDVLEAALADLADHATGRDAVEADRLREQAETAEQAVRDLRARHRDEVAVLKAENATLRRKLGAARAAPRQNVIRPFASDVPRARRAVEVLMSDRHVASAAPRAASSTLTARAALRWAPRRSAPPRNSGPAGSF